MRGRNNKEQKTKIMSKNEQREILVNGDRIEQCHKYIHLPRTENKSK